MTRSIQDLEILAKFSLSQILHLCTQKSVCATNFGPFGEIGANFSVPLNFNRDHILLTLKITRNIFKKDIRRLSNTDNLNATKFAGFRRNSLLPLCMLESKTS